MKKTFEHLLGLSAKDALALLKSTGIFDVRITYTAAPQSPRQARAAAPEDAPDTPSALEEIAERFEVADDAEGASYDPLLEPRMTDGMLTEARVIGVRDDGRQLLVSRFKVSPRERREDEMRN